MPSRLARVVRAARNSAFCAVIAIVATSTAQALVISEFRLRGPNGAADEYV